MNAQNMVDWLFFARLCISASPSPEKGHNYNAQSSLYPLTCVGEAFWSGKSRTTAQQRRAEVLDLLQTWTVGSALIHELINSSKITGFKVHLKQRAKYGSHYKVCPRTPAPTLLR